MSFNVPIALFNFNRPHLTRRVFEVVRQVKPSRLLLIADGPRADRPDDARLCAEVRSVFNEIDWKCEVSRNFSDTNLSSFRRNSSGLNWVFETVEEAIILEDDCIPSPSFFPYCRELLGRYRDEPRIGTISGLNLAPDHNNLNGASYFFSVYPRSWGWATWSRVWKRVDLDMTWWEPVKGRELLRTRFSKVREWRHWHRHFEAIRNRKMNNAWDSQLFLTMLRHGQFCALPTVNLVSNVGFSNNATHCTDEFSPFHNLERGNLNFPLAHPKDIYPDKKADYHVFRLFFHPSIGVRIKNKVMRTYRRTKAKFLNELNIF